MPSGAGVAEREGARRAFVGSRSRTCMMGIGSWQRGAIAGLAVRDIIGYCVTTLLFSGVVFVARMYLFRRREA